MKKTLSIFCILTSFSFYSPLHLHAEGGASSQGGVSSCFDDYHFGSVEASLSATPNPGKVGDTIKFAGTIKNNNNYPVLNLGVYVKIFRVQKNKTDMMDNGGNLVDQFFAVENLSLAEKSEKFFKFSWNVPRDGKPGEYYAATYTVAANRYNLGGLSFTDDVTGSTVPFVVKGEDTSSLVEFDKNNVLLNEKQHFFAHFMKQFDKDETVTLSVPLKNSANTTREVALSWKVYNWDGLQEGTVFDTANETVTLKPFETKIVKHTIKEARGPVTYVVAEAVSGSSKSIIDVRFVHKGESQVRLNFPSISKFPILKGEEGYAFSCFHSVAQEGDKGVTMTLLLKDKEGKVLSSQKYEGGVTGEMMALRSNTFIAKEDIDDATISATLVKDGKVIESIDIHYDCKTIDPTRCGRHVSYFVYYCIGGVVLVSALYFTLRKKKEEEVQAISLVD